MVSFYGWNRVDRFMAAWKHAGFSVVGHLVFTKTYTSKSAYVGYRHECAYLLAKGRPTLPQTRCRMCWAGNTAATGTTRPKTRNQPATADRELYTPERHCSRPLCRKRLDLRCGITGRTPIHRYRTVGAVSPGGTETPWCGTPRHADPGGK